MLFMDRQLKEDKLSVTKYSSLVGLQLLVSVSFVLVHCMYKKHCSVRVL